MFSIKIKKTVKNIIPNKKVEDIKTSSVNDLAKTENNITNNKNEKRSELIKVYAIIIIIMIEEAPKRSCIERYELCDDN